MDADEWHMDFVESHIRALVTYSSPTAMGVVFVFR